MHIFKKTQGQGIDLVILHGWCANHQTMLPIADALSRHYRVTAIDLPGCGDSDWSVDIQNIHDMADQLLPVLPKNAIYLGWSFGGLVTTSIAARHPERVKRFIGLTTSPKFIENHDWPGVPKPGFIAAFGIIKEMGLEKFMTNFYEDEFSEFSEKPSAYFELLKLLPKLSTFDINILLKGVQICDATDLRPEFSTLTCPIDLILGGKDQSIPVNSIEKIIALNSKANVHMIPNAKHMPFWTHPAEFTQLLNQIL